MLPIPVFVPVRVTLKENPCDCVMLSAVSSCGVCSNIPSVNPITYIVPARVELTLSEVSLV